MLISDSTPALALNRTRRSIISNRTRRESSNGVGVRARRLLAHRQLRVRVLMNSETSNRMSPTNTVNRSNALLVNLRSLIMQDIGLKKSVLQNKVLCARSLWWTTSVRHLTMQMLTVRHCRRIVNCRDNRSSSAARSKRKRNSSYPSPQDEMCCGVILHFGFGPSWRKGRDSGG